MVKWNFLRVLLLDTKLLGHRNTHVYSSSLCPVYPGRCTLLKLSTISSCRLHQAEHKYLHHIQNRSISAVIIPAFTQVQAYQKRFKHKKNGEDSRDDDSDSDSDGNDDEYPEDIHFEEDRLFPNNFTEKKIPLSSLRVDAILSRGLNIGRHKVDEYFLDSKLRVNGERLLKKSMSLQEGDCIDWIKSSREDKTSMSRVRIVLVSGNTTRKGRLIVYLRIWKSVTIEEQ